MTQFCHLAIGDEFCFTDERFHNTHVAFRKISGTHYRQTGRAHRYTKHAIRHHPKGIRTEVAVLATSYPSPQW